MLPEEKRKQLDGIVSQMVANKEDSNAIDFVVNDFKSKYSVKAPEKSFLERTANVLDMVFGGGKVGEAIGTQIAKARAKPEEKQFITPGPSMGEVAGSALQSAALFIPGGKLATVGTKLATKAGVKVGASAIGKIGTGIAAGEVFDVASNLQQGKTGLQALTPGLGAVIGGAIPAVGVAKNVTVRFADRQAPRIINSLIKPLAKDFSYGKNPGRAIADEGIIANNFDDLIDKIRTTRQSVGEKIGQLGDNLSKSPVLQLRSSLNPLDEAIKNAASQNNTTVLQRLNNVKRALTEVLEPMVDEKGNIGVMSIGSKNLENLTFREGRALLGEIGDLTAFTGNPSDDKIVNSTLKRIYGNIKEKTLALAKEIDPQKAQEFSKLTEKYADLSSAEIAAKYRDKIVQRSNLVGLSPQTVGIGTGLITAVATGGATIPAVLAGLTGAMVDKLASTPAFKTRLAYVLSTKTQPEVNYLLRKIPALKNFFSTKKGLTPGDVILNKIDETPNKKGGFVKVGKTIKSTPESTTVYHGTSLDNANKINDGGFKTGAGKGVSGSASNDFIYTTESKTSASKYVSDRLGIKNPTVVSGKITGKILDIPGKMADFEAFGEASKKLGVPLGKDSQGGLSMLDMPAIKKAMKEQGYSAIRFSDKYANGTKAMAVLPDQIKVASALKSPQSTLLSEAKKYKSAEEFVKAIENGSNISKQGKLQTIPLSKIKGTDYPELESALKNGKLSAQDAMDFLPDNEINMANSKVSMPIEVIKNSDGTYSLQAGNHRVAQQLVNGEENIVANIVNEKGSTKSQLTEIWNKANKK
jgi:hypothetical protein